MFYWTHGSEIIISIVEKAQSFSNGQSKKKNIFAIGLYWWNSVNLNRHHLTSVLLVLHYHPSICYLSTAPRQGHVGGRACPSWRWAKGRAQPGQVAKSLQGWHTVYGDKQSHTHSHLHICKLQGQFRVTSSLVTTVMSLDWGGQSTQRENPCIHRKNMQTQLYYQYIFLY